MIVSDVPASQRQRFEHLVSLLVFESSYFGFNLISPEMATHKPVAVVVGASRGIGRQVAIDLAKNGHAGKASSL